jgi:5-methylcytosine-specific restriction endonuclease McrA
MKNVPPSVRMKEKVERVLRGEGLEDAKRGRWRCQQCGRPTELQLHHPQARSLLGDDAEENLITLCVQCHQQAHPPR